MHDGTHAHGHPHTHDSDDNTRMETQSVLKGMDRNKLRAVLSYMEEHNREHARELRGLLAAIKELGADEILDLIENGAKSIEEAAGYIENALASLEEGAAAGLETAAETAEEIL